MNDMLISFASKNSQCWKTGRINDFIFDVLQDIFDALFWSSTQQSSGYVRMLVHLFIAVIYTWLHTILVLLQVFPLSDFLAEADKFFLLFQNLQSSP